jgi:hypothetical protein
MNLSCIGSIILVLGAFPANTSAQRPSTPYATSYQVNVNAQGQNIGGDAANEPSLCIDPTNPERIAIGWRQFDSVTSDMRQAGWAYSTNGGLTWTFPGTIETNIFRSDPVLAADAEGRFYYLGVLTNSATNVNYHCDLFRSTNGGMTWQPLGPAVGGDKEWMVIDTTSGPGRGNIYQAWSPGFNYANNPNKVFSRSTDGGQTWMDAVALPQYPYWGTLDIGVNGEVYVVGWDGSTFWVNRSTNAPNRNVTPTFDLTAPVDLGGGLIYGSSLVNPIGLLGQPWLAVDRSTGPTRGNVYVLSSVGGTGNPTDVVFVRSTDGGVTWSAPQRINDDATNQNAFHWFGTMSVAPNGRIDVCWNDTRNDPTNNFSELFYSFSLDGGLTWSTNIALSPPFNSLLGFPMQPKIGDYMGMVSLNDSACIAYSATFNGEEDVYFVRFEFPVIKSVAQVDNALRLTWKAVEGRRYCVESKNSLDVPWSSATTVGCLVATNTLAFLDDKTFGSASQRYYRVVAQP